MMDLLKRLINICRNNENEGSPNFNDSKNYREIEMMLKTWNQSHLNQIKKNNKDNDLESSMKGHELLDEEESFLKSKLQSSKRKDKRRMIREALKKKENQAIRAKTKLLLSSYFSDEGSPCLNDSKWKDEDDLKFSQTKMDEIIEVENEDQDNDLFDNFINQNYQRNKESSQRDLANSIHSKNVSDRYSVNSKLNNLIETPNKDDIREYDHNPPPSNIDICKEYENESHMIGRLMNNRVNNERVSNDELDEYRLSMPFKQENSSKHEKSIYSENYDYNKNNMQKANKEQNEEEMYKIYQSKNKNSRNNKNDDLNNEKSLWNNLENTNWLNSQYPAPATVATSLMQTAARTNYQESVNAQTIDRKFPRIIEEENSINSNNTKTYENNYRTKQNSIYSNHELVYQSISDQNMISNNQQKTAMRYSEQKAPLQNIESSEENFNAIKGIPNQNALTRNRNHFQKSSEFTFVGQRLAQSPHENCGTQYPWDLISSSRQSIILNPLTDVNPTSTTKKSVARNTMYVNNINKMTNIEEENIERQSEYDDQVNQYYYGDDTNNNLENNYEENCPEEIYELTQQNCVLQNLIDQYSSKNVNLIEFLKYIQY